MNLKKTLLLNIILAVFMGSAFADEPVLSVLELKPVEGVVPHHYEKQYHKMQYVLNDPFDYNPALYDAPTATTPAPEQRQVNDTSVFCPSSIDDNTRRWINGEQITEPIWDIYPFANSILVSCDIPENQSIKYLDLWARSDYDNGRNSNLIIQLYDENDFMLESSTFSCSPTNAKYKAFVRVDLTKEGFTDNMLTRAKKIRICHNEDNYKVFVTIAEVRVATETVDYSGTTKPTYMDGISEGQVVVNQDLMIGLNSDYPGTAYLVKEGTKTEEIRDSASRKFILENDTLIAFSTVGMELGTYKWYFMDYAGNWSDASETIEILVDEVAPTVTVNKTEFVKTNWVKVTTDEKSMGYIIDLSQEMNPDSIAKYAYEAKDLKYNGEENYLSTYQLGLGQYKVVVIDRSGNMSEVTTISVVAMELQVYEAYEILSAESTAPHYGEGAANSFIEALYNDSFKYDPNDPNAEDPDQIFRHGSNYDPAVDTAIYYPTETDPFIKLFISIPVNQELHFIDIWGRGDAYVHFGKRQNDLLITLIDTATGTSWTSEEWTGISTFEDDPKAYGRYYFSTAEVEPASLLRTADVIDIRHREGYDDGLSLFEMRIGGPQWENSVPEVDPGEDQTVAPGAVVTLDGSGSYDVDSATQTITYKWTAPSGITLSDATAMKPTFTAPQEEGTYSFRLMVTDSDGGKSRRATVKITVLASAINEQAIEGFKVYPNPSDNFFVLDLTHANEVSKVMVTDLTGKQLYNTTLSANQRHTLDVEKLAKGICILHIECGDSRMTKRLIVR